MVQICSTGVVIVIDN